MDDKKIKLQQQMELIKKKMRALEHAENEKMRKSRNEKIFNTGAIFDMVNSDLMLRKNTKAIPYDISENKTYRQLVGLVVSYNKIIAENNQEKMQQLENLGSNFLNEREKDNG
jgi:hypothetical protein